MGFRSERLNFQKQGFEVLVDRVYVNDNPRSGAERAKKNLNEVDADFCHLGI